MASRQCCAPSTSGRQSWCIPRIAYASRSQGWIRPAFQPLRHSTRPLTTHAAGDGAGTASTPSPAATAAAVEAEWVEVGVVGPPHGVRGEFKVQPLTDFPEERLGEPGPRWLRAPAPKIGRPSAAAPEEAELEWGRTSVFKGREVWIVKLEGIESPEEAALIRGFALLVPAGARPTLGDADEFYVQDLVGLRVVMDEGGEEVGTVVDIFDGTGTHDTLRIELAAGAIGGGGVSGSEDSEGGSSGGEEGDNAPAAPAARPRQAMLPFVKEMVPVVDVGAGVMRVRPPAGLFELATEQPEPRRRRRENAGKRERRKPRPGAGAPGGDGTAAPPPSDA